MLMSERALWIASALLGFLAVSLGAFGAHALRGYFAGLEDGAQREGWWQTAVQYHLPHAVAVAMAAVASAREGGAAAQIAGMAFICGVVLFSGSLYVMSVTGHRWLGAVTPFGGLALLAGWASLAIAALGWGR
jgi:uncharacterized membrane protein YgdD (TMEM256/DUF423 family)